MIRRAAERPGGEAADPGLGVRKARDGALTVPLIGLILLMPPVAQIFAVEGRILGIPVTIAYVFGVWLALIVAARAAGRRILATEAMPDTGRPQAGGGGE